MNEQVMAKLTTADGELLWWNWDRTLSGVVERFLREVDVTPPHGAILSVEWENPTMVLRPHPHPSGGVATTPAEG